MVPTIPDGHGPAPVIPAADLEPTAEQMAEERAHFASCANFDAARAELAITTVHIEALAAALAAGHTFVAAMRVQAMLASRRAYVERLAELDAAHAARTAGTR
ncbi:hypothetical protein [Parafrankia sp. BMG5.11]|uniref:hypothetical protein n=1 Tax=Parafrankia sp. BMG5.11 TaxID=222540 RepID=UPI00103EAC2D|nr:hypothetical protein [Parafrankia sp. BMG5.11]TCJ36853.1 hypothetical protein E0504_21485 [Parafrankia sp. BMG5.11]